MTQRKSLVTFDEGSFSQPLLSASGLGISSPGATAAGATVTPSPLLSPRTSMLQAPQQRKQQAVPRPSISSLTAATFASSTSPLSPPLDVASPAASPPVGLLQNSTTLTISASPATAAAAAAAASGFVPPTLVLPSARISIRAAFDRSEFFSIVDTRWGKSSRLNEIRLRARRCFFAIFFMCAAKRLIRREGILQLRVCDTNFIDDLHGIKLPSGREVDALPEELKERFKEIAIKKLSLLFQPKLMLILLRNRLHEAFEKTYRDTVQCPTALDLKLASKFFQLLPQHSLETLVSQGTRKVYKHGMWVGAPRSERSAKSATVNRSARSRLAELLPALSASGVLPQVSPALYSAFIVLHGSVVDLDDKECSIGKSYGETSALAEGGVTGRGFRARSKFAVTWEIDVLHIAAAIADLSSSPFTGTSSSSSNSPSPHHHQNQQQQSILKYIVDRRIEVMKDYFTPTCQQVQQWSLFRKCSVSDVTTHILPRLEPHVYFAGSTIAAPDSDRQCYFVARGRVTARGASAVEDEDLEWKSFGEYEGFFSKNFDLTFYASTIVDCWVLPRSVIQSIAKIPYLRSDMIEFALQVREAMMRLCGPSRAVIEALLCNFLGGKRLHPRLVDSVVMKLLQPAVLPAGDRLITAGDDERLCIFFVRGKLQESSAKGIIPHYPPKLYAPTLINQLFDPALCKSVGGVTSSWTLSLVTMQNAECWVAPVAKLQAALKIFYETCEIKPELLVMKPPPGEPLMMSLAIAVAEGGAAGGGPELDGSQNQHHHHFITEPDSPKFHRRPAGGSRNSFASHNNSSSGSSGGGGGGVSQQRQQQKEDNTPSYMRPTRQPSVHFQQQHQEQQQHQQLHSNQRKGNSGTRRSPSPSSSPPSRRSSPFSSSPPPTAAANSSSSNKIMIPQRPSSARTSGQQQHQQQQQQQRSSRKESPKRRSSSSSPSPPPQTHEQYRKYLHKQLMKDGTIDPGNLSHPVRQNINAPELDGRRKSSTSRGRRESKSPSPPRQQQQQHSPSRNNIINDGFPRKPSSLHMFGGSDYYGSLLKEQEKKEKEEAEREKAKKLRPFHMYTSQRGTERVDEMKKEQEDKFQDSMKGPKINSWLRLPSEKSVRRMSDLECLQEHLEPPDKRCLLLMRRLPQTPRIYGKAAPEFASSNFSPAAAAATEEEQNEKRKRGSGGGNGNGRSSSSSGSRLARFLGPQTKKKKDEKAEQRAQFIMQNVRSCRHASYPGAGGANANKLGTGSGGGGFTSLVFNQLPSNVREFEHYHHQQQRHAASVAANLEDEEGGGVGSVSQVLSAQQYQQLQLQVQQQLQQENQQQNHQNHQQQQRHSVFSADSSCDSSIGGGGGGGANNNNTTSASGGGGGGGGGVPVELTLDPSALAKQLTVSYSTSMNAQAGSLRNADQLLQLQKHQELLSAPASISVPSAAVLVNNNSNNNNDDANSKKKKKKNDLEQEELTSPLSVSNLYHPPPGASFASQEREREQNLLQQQASAAACLSPRTTFTNTLVNFAQHAPQAKVQKEKSEVGLQLRQQALGTTLSFNTLDRILAKHSDRRKAFYGAREEQREILKLVWADPKHYIDKEDTL